jgi:uncharacterized protein YjiS (DUF1127 family)
MNAIVHVLYPPCGRRPTPMERLAGIATAVVEAWRRRREQRETRAAFLNLMTLDDHMLDDLGLRRHEVAEAAALRLEENAGLVVRRMADERRAQERARWRD